MNNDTIGVDVSKDYLDAHRWLADGANGVSANTKGRSQSAHQMGRWRRLSYRVVFEPTGLYHRAVERVRSVHRCVPFVKVNPRQARRCFAEATGKLAKTDRLDAAILACMGASPGPGAPSPKRAFVRTEGALRRSRGPGEGSNRRQEPRKSSDALAAETVRMLSASNRSIARSRTVEAAILQIIEANLEVLADRSFAILISHSRCTQHHRLCLADRNARGLGSPEAGQAANLAGLAPIRLTVRRSWDQSLIHSRRSRRRPPSALHAPPSSPHASTRT